MWKVGFAPDLSAADGVSAPPKFWTWSPASPWSCQQFGQMLPSCGFPRQTPSSPSRTCPSQRLKSITALLSSLKKCLCSSSTSPRLRLLSTPRATRLWRTSSLLTSFSRVRFHLQLTSSLSLRTRMVYLTLCTVLGLFSLLFYSLQAFCNLSTLLLNSCFFWQETLGKSCKRPSRVLSGRFFLAGRASCLWDLWPSSSSRSLSLDFAASSQDLG